MLSLQLFLLPLAVIIFFRVVSFVNNLQSLPVASSPLYMSFSCLLAETDKKCTQRWKFGDYKNYTSLDLLTAIFNIPSPKDDIDGSKVGSVYWIEKDLIRIVRYCEKDVIALIQLYHCLHQRPRLDASKFIPLS